LRPWYSIRFSGDRTEETLTPERARNRIQQGKAAPGMQVRGRLDLSNNRKLQELPEELTVDILDVSACPKLEALPASLRARRLNLRGCTSLRSLPDGLTCYELDLGETPIRSLPPDLRVEFRLDLQNCRDLVSLPEGLKVGTLNLQGCISLQALPEGLEVYFLDLTGCVSLTVWPERASVSVGRLNVNGCAWVNALPPWLKALSHLDVGGCLNLVELPEGLRVASTVEIAGSGLRRLPESMRDTEIRWRGVPIDERIAFRAETITTREVLETENVELRRVKLERMGYDRFVDEAGARVIHQDTDPGGARRLLRIQIPDDEDLVCVSVNCPSTARQYVIRVPPTMKTCRQAVAWIAGFDDPDDYQPIAET
jgi:hypothetical protein